ncbi:hypothetical protein AQJ23_02195 [Streptomyces antibioticus]|nr:hypothetical protein [Streptomyces antibioticus]KUN29596.1 hypothetical protein AQJ23_02195 [Streptomyces antibioticus]
MGKFDEATWQLFAGIGLTPARLREARRGMVAVDQRISCRRELRAGPRPAGLSGRARARTTGFDPGM